MLVFAAIAPHSPLLIPSVGKEHGDRLKKTVAGLKALEKALVEARPDAILIISPHGPVAAGHFTIEQNLSYSCVMKDFGVMNQPTVACQPDASLLSGIREEAEDDDVPIMMRSHETLDHGVVIPLLHLTPRLLKAGVAPVYPSELPAKAHFEFGQSIQEVIARRDRRVAVIASVGLSHKLTEESPGGYSPRGKEFDDKVIQMLSNRNFAGLINFDQELAVEAGECGLSTLIILAGILDKTDARPEILSYEGPFGVGYLTARFHLGEDPPKAKAAVKRTIRKKSTTT